MIFQYGWEPVLIQWILIGFEAILENLSYQFSLEASWASQLLCSNKFHVETRGECGGVDAAISNEHPVIIDWLIEFLNVFAALSSN